jgi:4-hydroxybenzoate polyprenyltransferase
MADPVNTTIHTDIKRDGWIGRFLPTVLQPYALLMRLDRPIGIWLLLLPGWWSILLASGGLLHGSFRAQAQEWMTLVLFGAGAVIMRGAGCIINDLWDRDLDKGVARTAQRPLAAGIVSTRAALVFLSILLSLGLCILLQLSLVAVCLGVLSLPFIIAYPLMKRITWWPQAFLGLTFNFGALMGWSAVTGALAWPAFLLYAAGFFWTLGYDTIYADQDMEDDAAMGIRSSTRKLGAKAKPFVGGCYMLCWLLLVIAFALAGVRGIVILPLLAGLAHMVWQLKSWDRTDPGSALKMFKSNRDFGLLMLLAAAIG